MGEREVKQATGLFSANGVWVNPNVVRPTVECLHVSPEWVHDLFAEDENVCYPDDDETHALLSFSFLDRINEDIRSRYLPWADEEIGIKPTPIEWKPEMPEHESEILRDCPLISHVGAQNGALRNSFHNRSAENKKQSRDDAQWNSVDCAKTSHKRGSTKTADDTFEPLSSQGDDRGLPVVEDKPEVTIESLVDLVAKTRLQAAVENQKCFCGNEPQNPVMLPCRHRFCMEHLAGLRRRTVNTGDGGDVVCPFCGKCHKHSMVGGHLSVHVGGQLT